MSRIAMVLLLLCGTLSIQSLSAQDIRKRGRKDKEKQKPKEEIVVKTEDKKSETSVLEGFVLDETKSPVPGASVVVLGTSLGTLTQNDGSFSLPNVPHGKQQVKISYIGYQDKTLPVDMNTEHVSIGEIKLGESEIGLEEVQIVASYVRKDRVTPVAVSTVDLKFKEERMGSQELPQLLKLTPSVYSSNSGGGFGDSKIVLRGFQQEEIAVLINGIPINDMAASRVYWSNWQGLGDVLRTTQIQRGLGTSRLAISSVGGTMNFITKTTDAEKGGSILMETSNVYDFKTLLTLSTGLNAKGWAFTVSGGRTVGKGYIDNLTIDAWSYYFSATKQINSKHLLTYMIFGAPQQHGQRFTKLTKAQYDIYGGTQINLDYGYLNGQKLSQGNNYYHKPQMSLNHYWDISEKTRLSTSVYASWGRGGGLGTLGVAPSRNGVNGSLNWEALQTANRTGIDTVLTPNGKITGYNASGVLRDSRNDHDWYGLLSTLTSKLNEKFTVSGGLDARMFKGHNYRTINNLIGGDFWIEKAYANDSLMYLTNVGASSTRIDTIANGRVTRLGDVVDYDYESRINWLGVFGQAEYATDKLSAYVSLSVSNTWMKRVELMRKLDSMESENKSFLAYTVKGGANFNINQNHNIFANLGHFTRAPFFRYALVDERTKNEFVNKLVNEKVYTAEAGYGLRTKRIAITLNGYYTLWKDKGVRLAYNNAEGKLAYANITGMEALHIGVELEGKIELNKIITLNFMFNKGNWRWMKNVNASIINENDLSIKKIDLYVKGLKVGDAPQTSGNLGLRANITHSIYLIADAMYYADMYASFNPENRTNSNDLAQSWKLPSFLLFDLHLGYDFNLGRFPASIKGHVFNVLNKAYYMEAQDGIKHNEATSSMFYGYGRTFNIGLNLRF